MYVGDIWQIALFTHTFVRRSTIAKCLFLVLLFISPLFMCLNWFEQCNVWQKRHVLVYQQTYVWQVITKINIVVVVVPFNNRCLLCRLFNRDWSTTTHYSFHAHICALIFSFLYKKKNHFLLFWLHFTAFEEKGNYFYGDLFIRARIVIGRSRSSQFEYVDTCCDCVFVCRSSLCNCRVAIKLIRNNIFRTLRLWCFVFVL